MTPAQEVQQVAAALHDKLRIKRVARPATAPAKWASSS